MVLRTGDHAPLERGREIPGRVRSPPGNQPVAEKPTGQKSDHQKRSPESQVVKFSSLRFHVPELAPVPGPVTHWPWPDPKPSTRAGPVNGPAIPEDPPDPGGFPAYRRSSPDNLTDQHGFAVPRISSWSDLRSSAHDIALLDKIPKRKASVADTDSEENREQPTGPYHSRLKPDPPGFDTFNVTTEHRNQRFGT